MNTMLKRIVSLLLCLVMVVGYVPTNAFAEENNETIVTETTEPSTEATEPSTEATDPSTEAAEPSSEASILSVGATNSSAGTIEPSTEATEPSTETTAPAVIAVTGVTLDQNALEVAVGELPMTLVATVLPEDATDKTVTWTSSEPGVASVDENGVLTFGYMGQATITATAGAFSASCVVTVGEGEIETYDGAVYVLAASDFQHPSGHTYSADMIETLADAVKTAGYSNFSSFLYAGDYCISHDNKTDTEAGINALMAAISSKFNSITSENTILVQGNHDYKSSLLTASGENDTDDYGIFVINEDDYMDCNSTESIIKATGEALDAYLDNKLEEKYDKPIFVISHLPLHYGPRTARNGDGKYAHYLFDPLNEAGAAGLNIIFLYGHNHAYGYDNYLGGYAVYLPEGDKINIAKYGKTDSFTQETLNFTYMNAGFTGYHCDQGWQTVNPERLSMTVFAITDNKVEIRRINKDGEINLKVAGQKNGQYDYLTPSSLVANTDSYTSPQTVELNKNFGGTTPEEIVIPEGYVLARVEVIDQGTTKYFLNDTLDTDSLVVEAVYTKENAADVRKTLTLQTTENEDGYTVSGFDMSKPGKQYVTVTYGERTGSFAIEVFETHFENETGSVAVDFTNYGITSVTIAQQSKQVEGYSAYVTYDITPAGYTQGDEATVTIALDTALFDLTRPVKVLDQGAVIATPEIVDGKISFTTNHFSEYDVTQVDNSDVTVDPSKWIEVIPASGGTTTYTYNWDTDGKNNDVAYLIVSGTSTTVLDNNSTSGVKNATIDSNAGNTATASTNEYEWKIDSNNRIYTTVDNINYYLRASYVWRQGTSLSLTSTRNNATTWDISNNNGTYTISAGVEEWFNTVTYYLTASGISSRNSTVRLYKAGTHTTVGGTDATYGQLVGTTAYQVSKGTTAAEAVQKVKDGMAVYYTTDKTSDVGNFYDDNDDGMSWTMDTNYNPNAVGSTYTVTIKYNNVTLGTATVKVIDRVAREVKLDRPEGTVERDSSAVTQTGANLIVTWEDGTTEQVPVTLGMLSGNYNVSKNGTYTGLTVSYGGKTAEGTFTLNVVNKTGVDDYPTYPNPGSIDLQKSAVGVDFQNTGIARVELSTSGLPSERGVDVVVVLDMSSSMKQCIAHGTRDCKESGCPDNYRVDVLRRSLVSMIQQFNAVNPTTGKAPDVEMAIIDFNGYGPEHANLIDNTIAEWNNTDYANVYTGVSAPTLITGTTLSANNFVSAESLKDYTASYFVSGNTKSGTNYDDALKRAYYLLDAKAKANTESREQFVIFMSDGAPFGWNGINEEDGNSDMQGVINYYWWDQYLAGNYDTLADMNTAAQAHSTYKATINTQYEFLNNTVGGVNYHRWAEAIKGNHNADYTVYDDDRVASGVAATKNDLFTVKGLGATIYSIGFSLAADTRSYGSYKEGPTVATMEKVLKAIASEAKGEDLYEGCNSETELTNTFKDIAGEIAFAATNARYVDQMGDSFNLQMNPNIDTNAANTDDGTIKDGKTTTNTDITITTRPVYTKEDVDAGKCAVADIGKPYGNGTPVETVKFTVDADTGKITATTNVGGYTIPNGKGGTTTVTADSTNILVGGVIYGKNFFYNNNNAAVTVTLANGSTYSLPGETFYWNLGTINETLYTISYTVYLEGSMDGEGPGPGTYDTNNFAVLYYTNHVGNEVNKSVPSPALAWKGANVSYAFYLVNDDGQPVHADGALAQNFLQAHKLTQPVVYSSQELNSETGAYLSAAALAVLPEGYALFDPTATYQVWVASGSGEGSNVSRWLISGDNTTNTTCVVGFGEANDYSYVRDVQNTNTAYKGYDYTHTTVYFAVKWVVGAVQDTVVIDYGLPVDISVMGNDMFGAHGTLYAVGNRLEDGTVPAYGSTLATGFSTSSVNGTYGTATLNNGKVRYKLNSMTMPHSEKLAYAVDYQGDANKGYYYGAITVIPATTVYFEDEYVDLTTYKDKTYNEVEYTADSNKTITYYELKDGKYKIVLKPEIGKKYYTVSYTSVEGWPTDSVAAGGVQAEDRPGFHNLPIIDQNNIYGYDQAYDQMSTYSMGTSAMINVNAEQYGTAEFSFYGTGFDVISTTSNQTGTFVVDIYAGAGDSKTLVTSKAVDTYYGYVYGLYNVVYKKNDNGVWELVEVGKPAAAGSPNQSKDEIIGKTPNQDGTVTGTMYTWKPVTNNPNALYQVPVITHSGLTYGQYTVVVSALYYSAFDATTDPGYDLYLDAIRIYNPAGTTYDEGNKDGNIDDDIQKAYTADGEAWPSYYELRNLIISAAKFDALNGEDEEVNGIVFIDGNATLREGNTVSGNAITDYINYGPNNELYLAKGQAVAFNMNMGPNKTHEGVTYVPVVRIGLKTVGGKTAIAEMWNTQVTKDEDGNVVSVNRYNAISDKLETATDMYYDITVLNNKTVVIKNSGEDGSILSITNIKLTYKPTVTSTAGISETDAVSNMEQHDTSMKLTISKSAAKAALMSLAPAAQEELPEPSVPETTEPQEPVPEETVSDRLKAAVAAAKLLKEKDYTEKSFKALTTARKAAEKVLKDKKATEAKLEAALKALDAAVAALEAKADVTELKAAVAAAKKLKEKDYTAVSYKAVTTACKVAEKLMRDKNATQVKADEALEALNAAVAALEARADVTELKAAVDAAKKLKEKNYTPFSYKAVTTARKAAEKVMKDKNANQAAADAALEVLNAAVAALEAKPNLTALKTAVNAAKKLKEKNYTMETYEAVTTARKAAEKVMKDKNANQAAVDAALAELNAAVDALVERDFSVKTIKK